MATTNVSLKLLIDTNSQRVLFAEAGKDFVDFLFNILSLPIGTVVRLLEKGNMVGCLGNLYESIEELNETYIQPNHNKDSLLKPKHQRKFLDLLLPNVEVPLLLPNDESSMARQVYICLNSSSRSRYAHSVCTGYFADDTRAVCPNCSNCMNKQQTYVAPPGAKEDSTSSEGGYVKGVVTYMVMDDLVVKPISTISTVTLLNEFHVKEVGALEERMVDLSMAEGVELLKESLQSKTVLTNVFLGKKVA